MTKNCFSNDNPAYCNGIVAENKVSKIMEFFWSSRSSTFVISDSFLFRTQQKYCF